MPISNPPETKEHKGRVVEGNKVSDKYGVLAAMGQGRGSCSMQTIDRDKWSKGCGLSGTSERILGIGGSGDKTGETRGETWGRVAGGQSIIKLALSGSG